MQVLSEAVRNWGKMRKDESLTIVLVEDDVVDAQCVARAFRKHGVASRIVRASDGLDALNVLRGQDAERAIAPPYLILLDLNMPRMNGVEFLEAIRRDSQLRSSVVFVLTTSADEQDVMAAYEKNVAGYLVKARIGDEFEGLVTTLDNYWRYVELPVEVEDAR